MDQRNGTIPEKDPGQQAFAQRPRASTQAHTNAPPSASRSIATITEIVRSGDYGLVRKIGVQLHAVHNRTPNKPLVTESDFSDLVYMWSLENEPLEHVRRGLENELADPNQPPTRR